MHNSIQGKWHIMAARNGFGVVVNRENGSVYYMPHIPVDHEIIVHEKEVGITVNGKIYHECFVPSILAEIDKNIIEMKSELKVIARYLDDDIFIMYSDDEWTMFFLYAHVYVLHVDGTLYTRREGRSIVLIVTDVTIEKYGGCVGVFANWRGCEFFNAVHENIVDIEAAEEKILEELTNKVVTIIGAISDLETIRDAISPTAAVLK
jgi:hypothetical protein